MDDNLYDEFGNYIGPDVDGSEGSAAEDDGWLDELDHARGDAEDTMDVGSFFYFGSVLHSMILSKTQAKHFSPFVLLEYSRDALRSFRPRLSLVSFGTFAFSATKHVSRTIEAAWGAFGFLLGSCASDLLQRIFLFALPREISIPPCAIFFARLSFEIYAPRVAARAWMTLFLFRISLTTEWGFNHF